MKLLDRFLDGGEETLMKECAGITSIAASANRLLKQSIHGSIELEKIKKLEKESDNLAFELSSKVTGGGIAPNLIDDALDMINKEDNIVDSIYNLAREFNRYKIKDKGLNLQIENSAYEMLELADKAISDVGKLLITDSIDGIKEIRKKIEREEEKGDEIKDGMLDFAYREEVDFKSFYHIIQVAHMADDILDNCEDVSDVYLNIMSSIIT